MLEAGAALALSGSPKTYFRILRHVKREWQKIRERNEALDCRVYARAAAIAVGADRWNENKWKSLMGYKKSPNSEYNPSREPLRPAKSQGRPRVVRSRFMG